MRKIFFIAMWMMACVPLWAQTSHRDSLLAEARYLKSIYRTDDAIEKLSELVQPEAMDEGVLAELADCHFQSGDFENASGTYFLLSSLKPDNILYKVRLMQTFYRLKAYPQSIQAGKAVLQLDSIPAVVSYIGDGYRQIKQTDSALWYYRRALAMKPMNETVLSKAMGLLLDVKDYEGVIAISKPFLAEDPDNPTIAPLQGVAFYRKGDYDAAISVFQRQEDLGNDSYPIHFFLGQSYWHTQAKYRAEQELHAAWQIDSSDVNLAYTIASLKSEFLYPFEEVVKPWLDKVMDMLQPDPAMMSRVHQLYGLGYYRKQNSWDKAIEHYKEAYRYNPKYLPALSTIAYCYQVKKDYKQAIEWYEKYLKLVRPGTKSYEFAKENLDFLKGELFMEEQP
jgi:tetratricopeptide (TPR) repeat protein